jgi:protein involved in polysaccharide export with SLBB domain
MLDFVGRTAESFHLHVGGLLIPGDEHVRWPDKNLSVGDEVRIKIVEAASVDEPTKRFPRDEKKRTKEAKRYVRRMAKKLGWTIQTVRKRKKPTKRTR